MYFKEHPRMLTPEDDGDNSPEPITVDQEDRWKTAGEGALIETTALGPCIGVVIYDPETKQAMVAHFIDPREEDLEGMLSEAKEKFPHLEKLQIHVGGGEKIPDELLDKYPDNDDEAKRQFVVDQLRENGFDNSQVSVRWNDERPKEGVVMVVDTKSGKVDYEIIDSEEDEEGY